MSAVVRASLEMLLSILSCEISRTLQFFCSANFFTNHLSILSCEIRRAIPYRETEKHYINFQFSLARSDKARAKRAINPYRDFQFSLARSGLEWLGGRLSEGLSLSILSYEIRTLLEGWVRTALNGSFNSLLRDQIQLKVLYQQLTYRWLSILSCEISRTSLVVSRRNPYTPFNSLLRDQ